ncbi:hypothetical protein [Azospirillum sp.]|uniref:hypothetical protein n=1 Tax=Azospirillum sp. TaxID=34012 RepID=UPI002D5CC55D|nr:hypothetical protein [Azospirillum sp.]HYD71130.1 hypothetical protein [Azospirillum sp.]HYH23204.1 hypothetical protein [Azospirillum sp.]
MLTFDSMPVGAEMGRRELVLDDGLLGRWLRLFPDDADGDRMPAGMMAAVTMRAYAEILQPRPPGNVHGAQQFQVIRLPRLGERLVTALTCAGKELKRDRRWIDFATETTGTDGGVRFRGRMSILWAA